MGKTWKNRGRGQEPDKMLKQGEAMQKEVKIFEKKKKIEIGC